MKRFLSLVLALCLALGLSGCQIVAKEIIERDAVSPEGPVLRDNVDTHTGLEGTALYRDSLELAGLLEEMLRSPEYFALMGGSDHLGEVIIPLMRSDLSEPESAYLITLSEDALPLLMDTAEVDMEDFSPGLRKFLERRMFQSMPTMLNSQQGAETLAAASILTVSQTWAGESLEESCYVVLHYPDACPVMASFWGGDGLTEGTATLLIGTALEEDSIPDVAKLFQQLGIAGMHVQELEIDED